MSRGCSTVTVLLALQIYLPRLNSVFIKAFLNLKTSISADQMQQANKFINLPVCMNINLCVCSAQWKHTHTQHNNSVMKHISYSCHDRNNWLCSPDGLNEPLSLRLFTDSTSHSLRRHFCPTPLTIRAFNLRRNKEQECERRCGDSGPYVNTALCREIRGGLLYPEKKLLTSSNFRCKLSIIFTSFNCSNLKTVQINFENS